MITLIKFNNYTTLAGITVFPVTSALFGHNREEVTK